MIPIISIYNENISWPNDYNFDAWILNPSTKGHEHAILNFICNGYQYDLTSQKHCLPDTMCFLQANPFDHISKLKLEFEINKTEFTPLESYEHITESGWNKKGSDGGYMEINNSWFIKAHYDSQNIPCKYNSYDELMNKYFSDYTHVDFIRFSPGSQYIVPFENIINYSKGFWLRLRDEIPYFNSTESFLIERMLYYIFTNRYTERI